MRRRGLLAWLLVAAAVVPMESAAQVRAVGGHVGRVDSRQLWPGSRATETRSGLTLAAYIEVSAPVPLLSVMAEGVYAQRGGNVRLADVTSDPALEDLPPGLPDVMPTQIDYISLTLLAAVRLTLGPAGVYVLGGPSLDTQVRSRTAQPLEIAYLEETTPGLTMTGGVGVEVVALERWHLAVELRRGETVSPALSGPVGDIRHRTTEVVVRIGRRPDLP